MKKLYLIFTSFLLSIAILGCVGETTSSSTTSTTQSTSTTSSTSSQIFEYILIQGADHQQVNQGDSVDLLANISATDNHQVDYTNELELSGSCAIIDGHYLDTSAGGSCDVIYSITLGSYYQSLTVTYTILEHVINPDVITVYFQKPENWESVQIYYYGANITYNTTWDNAPEMTPLYGRDGWYYFSFPELITSIKVMFKDGNVHQVPESSSSGVDVTSSQWFLSEYFFYTTTNPFVEDSIGLPQIEVSTQTAVFSDDLSLVIDIASVSDITAMYYTVNGENFNLSAYHSEINLGAAFYIGERIEIKIYATNQFGEATSFTYLFIKTIPTVFETLETNDDFNKLSIYQIYVDAYQDGSSVGYSIGYGPSSHHGDLQGIINALDYIASLNVNAIWLTPIFTSKANYSYSEWETRGRSTGYFADDYFHVDPNFGTDEQFQTLVDTAHEKGLYVFLDGVFGHHGSYLIPGVTNGNSQWYGYEVVYPESLPYFIEVAQYWILEYGIDGWRLDQSYQLYQDHYNYWREIRIAVEAAASAREASGETWGTLGYLVGEDWESVSNINLHAYSGAGLQSAFDFNLRYALVASIGMDESYWQASFYDLNNAMNTYYYSHAQPNLFITNHDLVRFGDLLQLSGKDGDEYYPRHKMALSFLAQYTGPITIYYGDEYGDEFSGLNNGFDDLNAYGDIATDNVARTNGKITGFDSLQLDLIAYTARILELREQYSAMYQGLRRNLYVDSNLYVDLKVAADHRILYGLNRLTSTNTKTFTEENLGGTRLINLLTGESIYPVDHVFTVPFDGLSGTFYLVTN